MSAVEAAHGRREHGPIRKPSCVCGLPGAYCDRWDAYYCATSGAWLEEPCPVPESCVICRARPERAP